MPNTNRWARADGVNLCYQSWSPTLKHLTILRLSSNGMPLRASQLKARFSSLFGVIVEMNPKSESRNLTKPEKVVPE
jgi:hypothetical protein